MSAPLPDPFGHVAPPALLHAHANATMPAGNGSLTVALLTATVPALVTVIV